jgi:hypothetical protein
VQIAWRRMQDGIVLLNKLATHLQKHIPSVVILGKTTRRPLRAVSSCRLSHKSTTSGCIFITSSLSDALYSV